MAQVIARLAAQEAMGIQPPRFVYALLIEPGVNLLQGAPFGGEGDSPIFADFKAKVEKADLSDADRRDLIARSEEHTSELQSLMRISYVVFCLKQKNTQITITHKNNTYN